MDLTKFVEGHNNSLHTYSDQCQTTIALYHFLFIIQLADIRHMYMKYELVSPLHKFREIH